MNSVQATIKVRHDTAANWTSRNPVLAYGEYGLEDATFLLKIGDGVTDWQHLPYLNKLDSSYFTYQEDGTVTFSDDFFTMIDDKIEAAEKDTFETLTITNNPINPTDAANKRYVEEAIAAAGHLKRRKVNQLPEVANADENTIYMVPNIHGSYDEYMLIDNEFDALGSLQAPAYELPVGSTNTLGGVKSSNLDNFVQITQTGFMTLNRVSTSLLYVPDGDELVIYGGTA